MATSNLTNVISSIRPAGGANVQFDKPSELNLTAAQAQKLLTDIRAQITAGGTVQTGYLSLQRADNGEFTIENRSRFNAFGNKDGAAALVKSLIRIAYGDSIGIQSSAALETAIDAYLADKSFGKKLGTVSFVRLINELEVNVHNGGTATVNKKSSFQSLLGAGGSLAVDAAAIAQGAEVTKMLAATRSLMSQDAADSIPAALAQHTAHGELAARIKAEHPANPVRKALAGQLNDERSALADKLNSDIQARVDTIRPADATGLSLDQLSVQITRLSALRDNVTGPQTATAGPVTAATRQKIDDALAATKLALAGKIGPLQQVSRDLQARTLALMGQRVDGSGAASSYRFDRHALPGALQQHHQLSAEIQRQRNIDPVLLATSISGMEEMQRVLALKINADAVAAAEAPGEPTPANGADPLLQRLVRLQGLQTALVNDPSGALTQDTRSRVNNAIQTALSMIGQDQLTRLQTRWTDLQAPSSMDALVEPRPPTLSERSLKLVALNDLLQDLDPLVSQPGTNPDFIGKLRDLRTQVRDQLGVELAVLGQEIDTDFARDVQTPPTAEHRSQRSEALIQLDRQASRLQSLLSTTHAGDDLVTSRLADLALGSLRLKDAMSWFRPQGDAALRLIAERPDTLRQDLEQQLLTLHDHGLLRIPAFTELLGRVAGTTPGLAWIGELARGEAAAVNGLLNRPEWDELALQLKRRAVDAPGAARSQEADASAPGDRRAQRLAQIELDHQIHVSKRALDGLLRAANPDWGFSATTLRDIRGGQARDRALVNQAMQSLVFDAQTVKALVSARDNPAHGLNVDAFNLVLAKTIALQTAGTNPTPAAQAEAAQLLKLVLPARVTNGKSDAQLVELALGNLSSRSTDDLLRMADQLGTLASEISGKSAQLLAALRAFDTQTDGPRTRASQLVGRLTQDVVRVGAGMAANISAAGGEASNAHLLASAFGRELSHVRNDARATAALNGAVGALRSAGNLEAIDLSAVRQLMVPLVAQGDSGRSSTAGAEAIAMGAGTTSGALQYYFGVESGDMRSGDARTEVGQRIRNNVESRPMDSMFVKKKIFGGYDTTSTDRFNKLQAFLSRCANFGDGGNPPGIRAGVVAQMRDGLVRLASPSDPGQRAQAWAAFERDFAPPAEGLPQGSSKNAGRLMRELWAGLKTAVEKRNPAATEEEVTRMGQRFIALVEMGQRNAEIQQAATGLRSSHEARTAAVGAMRELGNAAPAIQKMALLVMLDQFVSSDTRDLNQYRTALLTRAGESPSALEVQLRARFEALLPQGQEGADDFVQICKGLLVAKEDANLLLKDLEGDGSLPAREGPRAHQAPEAVREFLVREELGQRLGDQVGRLSSGQAMTVRAGLEGGLSVGFPTPAGVDLTVGFSHERQHSVTICKQAGDRFTVVCKTGSESETTLGMQAFAKILSAKLGVSASAAGGFELEFETAQAASDFVSRMFSAPAPGTDPLAFMDAATRARVLSETGVGVSATVKVGGEVEVPGDLLGLSASFEASVQVRGNANYEHLTERTAFESVQTSRVTWRAQAQAEVGVTIEGEVGEVAGEVRDRLGARGEALQARGQAALDSLQARAESVSGQDLDARVARGVTAVQDREVQGSPTLIRASTQREQLTERRVVTRHGAVQADSCIREGVRDSARSRVSVLGQQVWANDPFSSRIAELVSGTPLADNDQFRSEVARLRSMAQDDFELVLQSNLRQDVAVQIGALRQQGGQQKEVERLLADRASYELHSIELSYTRLATDATSGLSSANDQRSRTVGVPEAVMSDARISVSRWSDANLRSTETVALGPLMRAADQQGRLMA